MYIFLDYFFIILHTGLIIFNLLGWIWRKTRRLHLYAICLTLASWGGLGIFYGWGYCPLADWHWTVKRKLGETDLPASYVKYYLDKLTGFSWTPWTVDVLVLSLTVLALCISCWLNWKDKSEAEGIGN